MRHFELCQQLGSQKKKHIFDQLDRLRDDTGSPRDYLFQLLHISSGTNKENQKLSNSQQCELSGLRRDLRNLS